MPLAWLRPPAHLPAFLGTAETEQVFVEIASPRNSEGFEGPGVRPGSLPGKHQLECKFCRSREGERC